MPKLSRAAVADNRIQIEDAARECFLRSGFHGVSVREIAKAADVSLGGIYNYFPDKLALFRGVLARQERAFLSPDNPVVQCFQRCDFPDDLERLAAVIQGNVERFSDYFKLIYIDVIEFDGAHIRELFSDLESKFEKVLSARRGPRGGPRPAFALTTVYLAFYQYFTLTRLFGAKNIYADSSDAEAVGNLIRFLERGVSPHA